MKLRTRANSGHSQKASNTIVEVIGLTFVITGEKEMEIVGRRVYLKGATL